MKTQRTFISCPHCEKEISKSNFARHINKCQGKKNTFSIKHFEVDGKFVCPHCGVVKSKSGIGPHIWRSHGGGRTHNPNISYQNGTKKVWNKGVSKETHPELAEKISAGGRKIAQRILSGEIESALAKYWSTPERRKQKSEWRKKLHKDFPETHPNRRLAGNRDKMSFPEKLIFDLLTELEITFEHQKKVGKYYPDFTIGQTIIEIDGEQWHDKEKDQARDNELGLLGYTVCRFVVKPLRTLEQRVYNSLTQGKIHSAQR